MLQITLYLHYFILESKNEEILASTSAVPNVNTQDCTYDRIQVLQKKSVLSYFFLYFHYSHLSLLFWQDHLKQLELTKASFNFKVLGFVEY